MMIGTGVRIKPTAADEGRGLVQSAQSGAEGYVALKL